MAEPRLAEGIEAGLAEAKGGRTITESILAILRPLSEESMTHPENMIAYEREALFGSAEHRDSATASVSRVEEAILEVLQLPRERRLRHMQHIGCFGHILLPGHSQEIR